MSSMTFDTTAQLARAPSSPPLKLLGMEPLRAAVEYASMRLTRRRASLPRGDGHAVVVFPGLAGAGRSTRPILELCGALGYEAFDWGLGLNRGPKGDVKKWLDDLAAHVDALTSKHTTRISLIGWSLGGLYAREVAKIIPRRVRCVITLGTPFAGTPEQTNVGWVYRALNGQPLAADQALLGRLRTAPTMPTTSIYSRTDGVVAWQACLNDPLPHLENVEVVGSHCGLGFNASAHAIIADRLSRHSHRRARPLVAAA